MLPVPVEAETVTVNSFSRSPAMMFLIRITCKLPEASVSYVLSPMLSVNAPTLLSKYSDRVVPDLSDREAYLKLIPSGRL